MERKESRNGFELIKFASLMLKGKFSAAFMGAFAMVTPIVLVILIPTLLAFLVGEAWIASIGIVLFALLMGPLQVGYIKYFNALMDGKQPKISMVYSQIRFSVFTLRTIYITTILIFMYILGGILWLIPAGFAISFYSMVLFFLEKYEYPKLRQTFNDCAKRMGGNIISMFSYKLIFYLAYFMVLIVGALLFALVYLLSKDSLIISWLIAVCSTIVFIFLYTIITVYFHSANQVFFEDIMLREERKKEKVRKVQAEKAIIIDAEESDEGTNNTSNESEKNNVIEKPVKENVVKETENKGTKKTTSKSKNTKKTTTKTNTKKTTKESK